jgi:hypothetical protein
VDAEGRGFAIRSFSSHVTTWKGNLFLYYCTKKGLRSSKGDSSGEGGYQQGVPKDNILARYEGAHVVTAAHGGLELHKSCEKTDDSGNVISSEQARGLSDHTMWDVWKGHGNHIQIRSHGNYQYQLEATAQAVLDIFEQKA